jgi:type I restriction enzyme S subunit
MADVKHAKIKATQFRRSLLRAAFTGNLGSSEGSFKSEVPGGWELKRLSDCLEKLKSGKKAERGWSPQCLSHPSPNENVWGVLKTTSVQMGEFQPEYNKELPESLQAKSGLEVTSGDFLVTTTGPRNRCGIVCYVKNTRKKLIFSGKILRFRVNESLVLPNWLMYLLMSPEYQGNLDKMKVGTSDSSVSIGNQQILDLEIRVPPIGEQRKIVEILEGHLSRLDLSVSIADAMEKQSIGLRRSLLQAAFTGQLANEVVSV